MISEEASNLKHALQYRDIMNSYQNYHVEFAEKIFSLYSIQRYGCSVRVINLLYLYHYRCHHVDELKERNEEATWMRWDVAPAVS